MTEAKPIASPVGWHLQFRLRAKAKGPGPMMRGELKASPPHTGHRSRIPPHSEGFLYYTLGLHPWEMTRMLLKQHGSIRTCAILGSIPRVFPGCYATLSPRGTTPRQELQAGGTMAESGMRKVDTMKDLKQGTQHAEARLQL